MIDVVEIVCNVPESFYVLISFYFADVYHLQRGLNDVEENIISCKLFAKWKERCLQSKKVIYVV